MRSELVAHLPPLWNSYHLVGRSRVKGGAFGVGGGHIVSSGGMPSWASFRNQYPGAVRLELPKALVAQHHGVERLHEKQREEDKRARDTLNL